MNLLGSISIESIGDFYAYEGNQHKFSSQQNGVMASKHHLLLEMALNMMQHIKLLPYLLWIEIIFTNCLSLKLWYVCPIYEKWRERKSNYVNYFHIFGSTCYIQKDDDGTAFKEMSQKMVKHFIRHM